MTHADTAERAIAEAFEWLESAKASLGRCEDDSAACNVACSQAIHSIIRANDALTLKFLGKKGTRHDDAPALFAHLIKHAFLKKDDEKFASIIANAMVKKSGADYGKDVFLRKDAEKLVQHAEEFAHAAGKYV